MAAKRAVVVGCVSWRTETFEPKGQSRAAWVELLSEFPASVGGVSLRNGLLSMGSCLLSQSSTFWTLYANSTADPFISTYIQVPPILPIPSTVSMVFPVIHIHSDGRGCTVSQQYTPCPDDSPSHIRNTSSHLFPKWPPRLWCHHGTPVLSCWSDQLVNKHFISADQS